jgi:hypothetical protein
MSVSATASAAFYAIRRNRGTSPLRCSAANCALDDFRKARDAPLLVSGEPFSANLDAIDEGSVLVHPLEGLGRRCPRFVKIDFMILGQHALLFCA